MTTPFDIMRERCGLSIAEAAEFLGVPRATVDAWSTGTLPMSHGVIVELRSLYRKIVHTGRDLGETLRIRLEQTPERRIEIVLARNDDDARACGFPCMGAQAAAVGIALMLLPDDVGFLLVPPGREVPTAIARHGVPIRERLTLARMTHAGLETELAGNATFASYRAAPTAEAAVALEAELRKLPTFVQWLSSAAAIRELETLARSTGAGS